MGKLISQSNNTLVYMESDGQFPIVWKVCGNAKNSVTALANEFTITSELDIKGVRRAVTSGIYNNKEGFSYKFFDGILLKEWIQNNPFDIGVFFKLALKITEILKELHNAGVCHLRINSNNILYNPSTNEVEIIDLSFSGRGPLRRYINFEEVSYELSYIAPEQTGRLNQLVDNRTDLYSLGIVFYEMLSGKLPFEEKDKVILVHMHLVLIPTPVIEVNKGVPAIISKIVDKLLCKNPEDRYQTIYGLKQDLALCAREYFESGELQDFPLGSYDCSYRLNLSQSLYGRDHEIIQIQNSIRSIKHGGFETYIITGDTGSGKSAFVQYFRQLAGNNEGIMLSGKFDLVSKNVPHSAMINALKELSAIILSEPNETLVSWKQLIKKTTAGNEKLFTDLVPEFKWIIEDVTGERISDDNSDEEINFDKTFSDILKGVALLKKYVILFLDDLHYADATSLKSIRSIVADHSISHLLLVLSYRKNAGYKEDKTTTFINEVKEIKRDFIELEMKNLTEEEILALINDSFDTAEPEQLSAILYKKTFGNPFFVHQLLHSCFSKDILHFNHDQQKWLWNLNKLLQVNITDNVIEYMTNNVQQLPAETLEIVAHAACIGNEFVIDTLSEILLIPKTTLQAQLQSLSNDRLIENKEHGRYQFVHDKLRQAVNDLIPGEKKSKIHYTIAKTLSGKGVDEVSGRQLYKIASHFDAGKTHIQPDERFIVAKLNLKAGLEAKRSGAFDLASNYLSSAAEMVNESDWSNHYEIALKLYLEATEVALIAGKTTEAEAFLTETINKAKTIGDRVKAYEIKLYHLSENHRFPETISLLLHVLDEIGFSIKRNPGKITLLKEYGIVMWYLKDKKINDLLALPLMENERANIFMRLTVNSLAGIFGAAPDILPLVIFRQVQLSLKYGNSVYSPFAYCFYGFALCAFMNDLKKGYAFGKMSLELTDKLHADIVKTKVLVSFYGFLSYWRDSLRVSVGPLNEAYAIGIKTGDLFYAAFALSFQSSVRLHAGDYLPELMEVMTHDCETIKGMNQGLVYNISESQRQFVINLANEVEDPLILNSEGFNEDVFLDNLVKMNDEASKFDFYYYKMALASIFNKYDEAFKNSELACKYEEETTSRQITYPSYILHAVIATFKEIAKAQPSLPKAKLLKKINSKIKLLKEFSKYAPENFRNKWLLAQAYMSQHNGNLSKAADYAYQSVLQAQKNNFVHEEALAREYLSYLYGQVDNQEYADMMLKSAFNSYQ
jgi:predicted ATPase